MYTMLRKKYDKLKAKEKKNIDSFDYSTELLNEEISMLTFSGFPETVDTRFMNLYAIMGGICGIAKFPDGNFYPYEHSFTGNIGAYNLGTESLGVNPIGSITKTIGKDCALLWHNYLGVPAIYEIESTSNMLAETDTSERALILYSRLAPLLVATDEKTRISLTESMKSIFDGGDIKVISSNILEMLSNIGASGQPITKIDLTDVSATDKLQYLAHFKDDVFRQWHTKRGHATQGTGKMAQQTEKEISGQDGISFIYPLMRLQLAKDFCEECNKLFGWNTSVEFSESLKIEYENFKNSARETEENENVSRETLEESEDKENE